MTIHEHDNDMSNDSPATGQKSCKSVIAAWTLLILVLLTAVATLASCKQEGSSSETQQTTPNPTTAASSSSEIMNAIPPMDYTPMVRPLIIYGEQEALIYSGQTAEPVRLQGPLGIPRYSLDGSKTLFRVQEQGEEKADLWYFDGYKVTLIATAVNTADISDDGTAVCYLKDIEESPGEFYGEFGDLYRYDCMTGTTELVDQGVNYSYDSEFGDDRTRLVLSPDGHSIGYEKPVRIADIEFPDAELYNVSSFVCVEGSQPENWGPGIKLIAISNKGQMIYYFKATNTGSTEAVVKSGGTDRVIQSDLDSPATYFNSDYSEVLFCDYGDGSCVTYFNVVENLSLKLADEYGHVVWPRIADKNDYIHNIEVPKCLLADRLTGVVLNFNNTSLMRLTEDHQLERLAHMPYSFWTGDLDSHSQAYAYFKNAGEILFCPAPNDPNAQPVELSTGLDQDSRGRFLLIYHANLIYIDEAGALWQVNASGDKQLLTEDIDGESIRLSQDGQNLYFLEKGETTNPYIMYRNFYIMPVNDQPVITLLAENVTSFAVSPQGVAYAQIADPARLDNFSVFYSQDGRNFIELFNNQLINDWYNFANYCLVP